MVNCLCRQSVIRVGFGNGTEMVDPMEQAEKGNKKKKIKKIKCTAREDAGVRSFYTLWTADNGTFGGSLDESNMWSVDFQVKSTVALFSAAKLAVKYFLETAGGIWTGCIRVSKSDYCRGALSAAALLEAIRLLSEMSASKLAVKQLGSHITEGYMLASIGRSLLHGSSDGSFVPLTPWRVRLSDFTALQSIFLRLYMTTFGTQYTAQLNKYIPQAFQPSFQIHAHVAWKPFAHSIEPVYTSLRNWMFSEARNLIDFGPYLPLVAIPAARAIAATSTRRILIDVGANGFLASPKYLIDSYAIFLPFTHVIMVEPEPHFSASVPAAYAQRYNIQFLQIYAEVATGSDTDMIQLLPKHVTKEDFVVLKFDVDPNRFAKGPTMEWGFLFALMGAKDVVELIDEIYIELHFHYPDLDWHHYHSNWEGLDVFRYLRDNGVIVHCWP